MENREVYTAIGLMSGTSLDGVDVAVIETDGESHVRPLEFLSAPYPEGLRNSIRRCLGKTHMTDDLRQLENDLTILQAGLVKKLDHYKKADIIGFHGQTIYHAPQDKITIQLGNGALMGEHTGIDTINDFRRNDIDHGGEGAPFLPLYHRARLQNLKVDVPAAIVNIGGVSNITYISGNTILAFDSGPGNALIDDFIKTHTGDSFDKEGALAAQGDIRQKLVEKWLDDSYFMKPPPKSLDRDHWQTAGLEELSIEDSVATLTEFTIRAISESCRHLPTPAEEIYVTGGGRHNKTIMKRLKQHLKRPVEPVETLGWNGDALEAEGFAYLAVRALQGQPLSLPQTTGVSKAVSGGILHSRHEEEGEGYACQNG